MKSDRRGRKDRKPNIYAILAGVLCASILLGVLGFAAAHARKTGGFTVVDEKGRVIGGGSTEISAEEEPVAEEEIPATPGFTEEEIAMLNEAPEETEAALEPETPLVTFSVESVEEVILPEAIVIKSRSGTDPYTNVSGEIDDALTWTGEIPAAYNANDREEGDVITEVKHQGASHLCWAYAALGAIEANLLVKHPLLGVDRLDLSEKHLAYYVMNPASGSQGGLIDNDYRQIEGIGDDASQKLFQSGLAYIMASGVTDYIISALAAWKGPVDDAEADKFLRQRTNRITIEDQGPPSQAYGGAYHVQGIHELPAIEQNRDAIKRMILSYGAVTCGVHASQEKDDNHWYMSNLYDADPYGVDNNLPDHEVLLIGWDDAYEVDNFRPYSEHEGAWLCRNSWGATAGENGYFWLSYDDVIFTNNNVAAYDVALNGDPDFYDRNYQVAGLMTHAIDMMIDQNNVIYSLSESMNPYAVMYTAQEDEELCAVSLFALETENSYSIEITLDPEMAEDNGVSAADLENPAVTQLCASASGGYHTYKLDEPLSLQAGQRFMIVVKPQQPSGLVFEKSMTSTGDACYDEDNQYIGNIKTVTTASGLSYYCNEDGSALVPLEDADFFVKAFTKVK